MKPAQKDLSWRQGDSFDALVRMKSRDENGVMVYTDLTGVVPRAQVRPTYASDVVLVEIDCTLTDQVTLPGGVLLHVDPAVTAALSPTSASALPVWDLELTWSPTEARTVYEGKVTVDPQVTR